MPYLVIEYPNLWIKFKKPPVRNKYSKTFE